MSTLTRSRSHSAAGRSARIGLVQRLWRFLALRRQRAHLGRLDDHMLRDIGLTRDEAAREAARPVWDAPSHWQR